VVPQFVVKAGFLIFIPNNKWDKIQLAIYLLRETCVNIGLSTKNLGCQCHEMVAFLHGGEVR
jgi:hypothetical protein